MKNLKFLIVALLTTVMLTSFIDNESSIWLTDYKEALTKAKAENKLILMDFSGSDWCSNCIRLEKSVFQTEVFNTYAKDKFILLNVDFPMKSKNKLSKELTEQNAELAKKYNSEGQFPTVIIMDSDEKVLARTGYIEGGAEVYIKHLNDLLK
ncbi:MAG: thiol-disulfide isomerase [Flavobacteriales bacterium CG18_big_fil_WC_8_21_14_2_50_32_9]|nr:MAG: thiol-disulfide isomerase [Flavobacteriales bacterium CG18_big_fil_WC_8_21_14_2_50_32_9]PJC61357.1 MAG: thioredoxin family protein [Flavobacteriales bacterium CG_4_9_14_0_2_um_filter_32_27]